MASERYGARTGRYSHLGRPSSSDSRYSRSSRGRGYGYDSRGYSKKPYREPGFSDEEHHLFNVVSGSSGGGRRSSGPGFKLDLPSLSLGKIFDREFDRKKGFFLAACILFVLAMIVFSRTNIHLVDIFDLARIKFNLVKFWSPYFIIFGILFSLTIAATIFFASRLKSGQAMLMLPAGIILSLLVSFLYPHLLLPFVAFSVSLGVAGLLSSEMDRAPDVKSIWFAVSASLLVLAVLTACYGYYTFSSEKEEYTYRLIENSYKYMWDAGAQNRLSDACLSLMVSSGLSSVDAGNLQVSISRDDSVAFLTEAVPGFANKSEAEQNELIAAYELNLRKGLGSALKGVSIDASAVSLQIPAEPPEFDEGMMELAMDAIHENEQSEFAYRMIPLIATGILVAGVLIFSIFVQFLASVFAVLAFEKIRQ